MLKMSGIPEVYYLRNFTECLQEGCKEILQVSPWDPNVTHNSFNGFVFAANEAYNRHHNLAIRPDDL
jgi:hypothetical protein